MLVCKSGAVRAGRVLLAFIVAACMSVAAMAEAVAQGRTVIASWYGGGERLARHTASGEVFRPGGLTAAHRSLPFGARVRVFYAGRSIVVRINDRGPAAFTGRSLDLSRGAARALGMGGTARVTYEVLG